MPFAETSPHNYGVGQFDYGLLNAGFALHDYGALIAAQQQQLQQSISPTNRFTYGMQFLKGTGTPALGSFVASARGFDRKALRLLALRDVPAGTLTLTQIWAYHLAANPFPGGYGFANVSATMPGIETVTVVLSLDTLAADINYHTFLTVPLPAWTVIHLRVNIQILEGVDPADPLTPPAAVTQPAWSQATVALPFTTALVPTPTYQGPAIMYGASWRTPAVSLPPDLDSFGIYSEYELNLAPGLATKGPAAPPATGDNLSQMELPELVLTPGCTIRLSTRDTFGIFHSFDFLGPMQLVLSTEFGDTDDVST